jgi:hypothetical protein
VFSSDNTDESKSCDVAKAAAPLVASHLPGGAPAPSVLPTATASSSVAPEPSGPLVSVQPCSLLKPDQVAALTLDSRTDTLGKASDPQRPPGCEWHDTDGDRGQKSLDVYVAAARPAKQWPLMDVAGEPFEAAGKKWTVFPSLGDSRVNCAATLSVTDTSSVAIISGYLDDVTKICDLAKAAIPLVTANLPAS